MFLSYKNKSFCFADPFVYFFAFAIFCGNGNGFRCVCNIKMIRLGVASGRSKAGCVDAGNNFSASTVLSEKLLQLWRCCINLIRSVMVKNQSFRLSLPNYYSLKRRKKQ